MPGDYFIVGDQSLHATVGGREASQYDRLPCDELLTKVTTYSRLPKGTLEYYSNSMIMDNIFFWVEMS